MNVSPSIPSHKEPPSLNEDEDANPTRLDFPSTPPGVLPSIRLPFHIVEPVSPLLFAPTQQGMFVSFKDITYDVPNRANKKESLCILDGISGCFEPGMMTCLMGPSGSGKSTLANILGGKEGYEVTQGSIQFDGKDLLEMDPEVRAREGLFLAFQYPVELPGVIPEGEALRGGGCYVPPHSDVPGGHVGPPS